MDSSKVYLVDDEPVVRVSLVALISSLGIPVEEFASADDFLQSFVAGEPEKQCVLADLRMPEMSGLQLKRELVARGCDVPVILLSGMCTPKEELQARQLKFFATLDKPCPPNKLESVIRRALETAPTVP